MCRNNLKAYGKAKEAQRAESITIGIECGDQEFFKHFLYKIKYSFDKIKTGKYMTIAEKQL